MNTSRALTLFLALALLGLVLLALATPTARAADPLIVRVTTSGTTTSPCGDQTNWSNPCALDTALTIAAYGDELWVASGTYTPTMGVTRTATFQLRDGIALYGGFAMTETLRSQRNFTANVTILSGDLSGNDNSNVRYDEPTRDENAYHVVTGSGVTNTAVLDGFTVTGGNANAYYSADPAGRGGGIYNQGGSPTLTNVTFSGNSAKWDGAGMYNSGGSPTLTNVTFSDNWALWNGGGMENYLSSPTLTNVTFSSNSARYGGGLCNWDGSPTLSNVSFISNTVSINGGGMYSGRFSSQSNPTLVNVTFSSNRAHDGGGMYNSAGNPTLINVTFSFNWALVGYGGGMHNYFSSNATLTNVTFRSNWGSGMYNYVSSPTLSNVTFSSNWDSGMYNVDGSNPTLTNVTFISNTASLLGGGMYNKANSSPTLTNVTFRANSAYSQGGAMYNYDNSNPTIRNTIVWGNTAPNDPQIYNYDTTSTPSLSDSVVQGGCPAGSSTCTHIITADPRLGALGNYGGSTQTIPLLPGSSAIDAGDDATCAPTDQRGIPRPQGSHCDIGAFESRGFTLTKTSGDNQSTLVNTAFATALGVTVTSASGEPVDGGVVTFTAPSSGASATPVTSTVMITSGAVTRTLTANGIVGSYAVTATTSGANPPATFTLTNLLYDFHLPLIRK